MAKDVPIKSKINKIHKTIDLADLDYVPQRKGSGDSLDSQRSAESQQSSDSHSSVTVRESKIKHKDIPSLEKHEQWSFASTRSETDSETGVTRSAPPTVGERVYGEYPENEDVWRKRCDFESSPHKSSYHVRVLPKHRLLLDSKSGVPKRESRYVNENANSGRGALDGLISLPPIRRQPRDDFGNRKVESNSKLRHNEIETQQATKDFLSTCDRAPSKVEEILGKPEAPLRAIRKPRRDHVRSLGEEVTDSTSLDKNFALRTIDESNVVNATEKRSWSENKEADGSFRLLQSEAEWGRALNKQSLTPKRQRSSFASLDLRRRNSDPATKIGEFFFDFFVLHF